MWRKIPCSFTELNLEITLGGGQSFRWNKNAKNEWIGVISDLAWILKQDSQGNILYVVNPADATENKVSCGLKKQKRMKICKNAPLLNLRLGTNFSDCDNMLKDYFNLHINLDELYNTWGKADENFRLVANHYKGIRILRQDPLENVFSFICSANNNISRISSMVGKLCSHYGKAISVFDGTTYYAFPALESLAANGVEETLRKLGFGYRAKYIHETAKSLLHDRPSDWLKTLRTLPYAEAHAELIKLPGIGAKVADCICLMSLDKYNAIPVDTHIWQVTLRDYLPHLKNSKTLTSKIFQEIGNFYRERFGDYAGWANTVLFAADLKKFKEPDKVTNKT
ncbi:LOW QUALITY PROTEIN: N-glycosylase/DNA lyase-like [Uloborus diversus]|uniref:LOW QUALITY PROTEIN: N-glycosylase/DNA lyase-like n=1 Tax=Uloborus diversus TaxID=327109 RepID=UPI00240A8DDD|nr:LOW QUALITY PROTEIN: N-glycosylase/DNA lyase-like [Uloborus diversus]